MPQDHLNINYNYVGQTDKPECEVFYSLTYFIEYYIWMAKEHMKGWPISLLRNAN